MSLVHVITPYILAIGILAVLIYFLTKIFDKLSVKGKKDMEK